MKTTPAPKVPSQQRRPLLGHYTTRIASCAFYPFLLVVLGWGVGLTTLLYSNHGNASGGGPGLQWLHKGVLEQWSLWVLGAAFSIALIRWIVNRRPCILWMAGVTGVFLCREIHFVGTSEAVYVGIVTLFTLAMWKPRWTEDLLATRRGATLFMLSFACYLFAVSLDGRWWFDWNDAWKDAAVLAEEVMELTGHLMILTLGLVAPHSIMSTSLAGDPTSVDSPGLK